VPQVEGRKRHEFLEAAVSVMDGHLRYFKAGYEALLKVEPYLHQVGSSSESLQHLNQPRTLCGYWAGQQRYYKAKDDALRKLEPCLHQVRLSPGFPHLPARAPCHSSRAFGLPSTLCAY